MKKRLPGRRRVGELEGGFYKYFDVYSVDRDVVLALSILIPGVMIELRDKGYGYGVYGASIYVISSGKFSVRTVRGIDVEVEAFRSVVDACIKEPIPQAVGRVFSIGR